MRTIILGASGAVGQAVTRVVAEFSGIEELVVADLRGEESARLVAGVSDTAVVPRISSTRVDVTDGYLLRRLLRGLDTVVNVTGPYYRLGVPVLEAAIDADCHYLDACDDWEPTLEMLGLDARAKRAGVSCVVGMGASPGASNLLAVLAARELDEVDHLYTAWPVDVPYGEEDPAGELEEMGETPSAAAVHWMQQISGSIRAAEDGRLVDRAPLEAVLLDYPGLGRGTAYTMGHPEPVTLPAALGVRGSSSCLMVVTEATLAFLEGLRRDIDAGKLTNEDAAGQVLAPSSRRVAGAALRALGVAGPGSLPPFFALAVGEKAGRPARAGARLRAFPRGMDGTTGVPLALGLRQLAEGRFEEAGVFAPEAAIDPEPFFDALAPYCAPRAAGTEELVEVAVEADPSVAFARGAPNGPVRRANR